MKESIRVFKLSNGDTVIGATLTDDEIFDFTKPIQISYPLKMVVMHRMMGHNQQESLSLSPWVHPMTESEYVDINSKNVIMSAPASTGLQRYYNHCVNQFDFKEEPYEELTGPTDEDLDEIEKSIDDMDIMYNDSSDTIH
jgi:hypothetical protein